MYYLQQFVVNAISQTQESIDADSPSLLQGSHPLMRFMSFNFQGTETFKRVVSSLGNDISTIMDYVQLVFVIPNISHLLRCWEVLCDSEVGMLPLCSTTENFSRYEIPSQQ
jgi:hypothetical protein